MGAKAWFAAYFDGVPKEVLKDGHKLNRNASRILAERVLPNVKLNEKEDGALDFLNPDSGEVYAGDYGDLKIAAHDSLGVDRLSQIDPRWYQPELGSTVYVHATHSVSDWCAFAIWEDRKLVRALSVSPDTGIIEDIGERLPFEIPFWNGDFPAVDEKSEAAYPLPFHPLELSEAALLEHVGFQFEGASSDWVFDPSDTPIAHYEIQRTAWWKFW